MWIVNINCLVNRPLSNFSCLFDLTASDITNIQSFKDYLLGIVKVPMKELLIKRSGKDPRLSLFNPTLSHSLPCKRSSCLTPFQDMQKEV